MLKPDIQNYKYFIYVQVKHLKNFHVKKMNRFIFLSEINVILKRKIYNWLIVQVLIIVFKSTT